MYQAIVFLPLLGAVLAALIALAGARARCPGEEPAPDGQAGGQDKEGSEPGSAHRLRAAG